jgi:hypothetical protein
VAFVEIREGLKMLLYICVMAVKEKIIVDDLIKDIEMYKDLKRLIDFYDSRNPYDWAIELHHKHSCMLGEIHDYSSPLLLNKESIEYVINKIRVVVKNLEEKLGPFQI